MERLAAGPISWGVCEVPGWGVQLPPDRVLAEVRAVGIRHVEAGPIGYLGVDADAIRTRLERHGLSLVGGFVPVVLHDPVELADSLTATADVAALYAEAGARVLVSAVVVDLDWSARIPLDALAWRRLCDGLRRLDEVAAGHGLLHALHPHVGTLVETAEDVERVLDGSASHLCLDTGHLTIGGVDTARLARDAGGRIGHVHLKDVSGSLADEVRAGRLSLVEATRRGLFVPLGAGDAPVAETIRALDRAGYEQWYVLEQDTTLSDDAVPPAGSGPAADARRSIEFLAWALDARRPAAASTGREVGRTH